MKRKKFSKEFKAKVILEAIKGQLTANEFVALKVDTAVVKTEKHNL